MARGAYVLADAAGGKPDVILIGTGSEVSTLRRGLRQRSKAKGVTARVVSMPSWELFEQQDEAYRNSVLPPDRHRAGGVRSGTIRLGPLPRHRPADLSA